MFDAYVALGPNAMKLLIFLEEVPLEHRRIWLDLTLGEHRTPKFLELSPNAKVPVIVDHKPTDGQGPAVVFESGAILLYLADKHRQLVPASGAARGDVLKWLFWQMAALGPMAGQAGHFRMYAPKDQSYALGRYQKEAERLFGVFEKQLQGRDYVAGDFSIADIACFPWIGAHRFIGVDIEALPNTRRWLDTVGQRPAVKRAQDVMKTSPKRVGTPEEFRKNLFNDHCDPQASPMA